jgi:hypothetical protein
MNETKFLSLMMKARKFSGLGEHSDYWHGYQRGLRRGYQGELFGTDAEHCLWMRLADDGPDYASRERGRGYRDGLSACAADAKDHLFPASPLNRGTDQDGQAAFSGTKRAP